MADSLFDQIKSRGEAFITEVSNNLMSNPSFIEMLKKGIAAKETLDRQVGEAMKNMNVATRKDLRKLEERLAALEAELAEARAKVAAAARPRTSASARTTTKKSTRG